MQPRALRPERARQLRANPTEVEKRLWMRIRKRQLLGHRFRRQVPLGRYVVDFACIESSLVVEVDGGQHDWLEKQDAKRTLWLEAHGWRVVRFWNNDVIENIEGVLEELALKLSECVDIPHPDPPPQAGEGNAHMRSGGRHP